jgi:signal transduction histidine kinase
VVGSPTVQAMDTRRRHWNDRQPPAAALAIVIALVQTIGTTIAARGEPGRLDLLGYALLAASALALAGRREHPVPTVLFATAATTAYTVLDYPSGPTFVALIIAAIDAVKARQRFPTWGVLGAGYAAWVLLEEPTLRRALLLAAWGVGLLVVAELARVGAQYRDQAAQVWAERERTRQEQQRRQASEERLRIAQELHDVLGHHLSLINVQAGVGLHLMESQPDQARAALGAIKQASAEALREVRAVLASLSPEGEAAPRTPAPGLDRLADLTDHAGLPVLTAVKGAARPLPAELDRAAYRIVQEALTNVRRHAGAGATAAVTIEYREDELVVSVVDDGAGAEPVAEGTGIGGMRERAAAVGGTVTAGPRSPRGGRGFSVLARLPLPEQP